MSRYFLEESCSIIHHSINEKYKVISSNDVESAVISKNNINREEFLNLLRNWSLHIKKIQRSNIKKKYFNMKQCMISPLSELTDFNHREDVMIFKQSHTLQNSQLFKIFISSRKYKIRKKIKQKVKLKVSLCK